MSSRARTAVAVLAVLLHFTGSAAARENDALPSPLDLPAAVRIARERRPEVRAARKQAEAAAWRGDVVDAIDDPMLITSIDHLPVDFHGVDVSAAVEVSFPLSGILGDRRRAAEHEAKRLLARADRVALDVELDAATAYLMLYEARRLDTALRERLLLAGQLRDAAVVRLGAASGSAAEVLRADVELARARSATRVNRAARRSAAAMLNAALARPVTAAVPPLSLKVDTRAPKATAALLPLAKKRRPELREAQAEIARSRAEVEAMDAMYVPMAVARFGPAYSMAEGVGFMFMFGVSLPLDVSKKRAGVSEARAMVAMSEADAEAMALMVGGEVAAAREAVSAQRERLLATRDDIIPSVQAASDASLVAYAAGELPLVSVIEVLSQLSLARHEEVRAEVALGAARARLRRALGQRSKP